MNPSIALKTLKLLRNPTAFSSENTQEENRIINKGNRGFRTTCSRLKLY